MTKKHSILATLMLSSLSILATACSSTGGTHTGTTTSATVTSSATSSGDNPIPVEYVTVHVELSQDDTTHAPVCYCRDGVYHTPRGFVPGESQRVFVVVNNDPEFEAVGGNFTVPKGTPIKWRSVIYNARGEQEATYDTVSSELVAGNTTISVVTVDDGAHKTEVSAALVIVFDGVNLFVRHTRVCGIGSSPAPTPTPIPTPTPGNPTVTTLATVDIQWPRCDPEGSILTGMPLSVVLTNVESITIYGPQGTWTFTGSTTVQVPRLQIKGSWSWSAKAKAGSAFSNGSSSATGNYAIPAC